MPVRPCYDRVVPRRSITTRVLRGGAKDDGRFDREFWQRVEERNKNTAAVVDRLGLPEYFAMEAYVVRRNGERVTPELLPTSALGTPVAKDPPKPRAR